MDIFLNFWFVIGIILIFLFYFTRQTTRLVLILLFLAELIYLYLASSVIIFYLIGIFLITLHFVVRGWHKWVIFLIFAGYLHFLWVNGFFSYRYQDDPNAPKPMEYYLQQNSQHLFSLGVKKDLSSIDQ